MQALFQHEFAWGSARRHVCWQYSCVQLSESMILHTLFRTPAGLPSPQQSVDTAVNEIKCINEAQATLVLTVILLLQSFLKLMLCSSDYNYLKSGV